ncbi:hypothetical protein BsWGS_12326 [Bradybaena similaris]
MVFKVSKGGVRSGNTLRGLRCLRRRRYSRQACIVGRSSLPPTELADLLDSSGASDNMGAALGATDTILSLNKKARWLLPVTLRDMIKNDRFSGEKTVVSLLERHKLKRTSNCVSFICNQGKIRHVVPRQKRYFSFNPEKVGTEQSNRQRKQLNAKVMTAMKAPQVKIRRSKQSGLIKTVNLFTISGSDRPETSKTQENKKGFYQLEVFYPCPESCSLGYNPKYTNVQNINEEDKTQAKANIKSSRAKRKHRKAISSKDFKVLYEDATRDCEEGFSESDELVEDIQNLDKNTNADLLESNISVDISNALANIRIQDSSNLFTNLITEAEKAKSLCDRQGCLRGRKLPRRYPDAQEKLYDRDDKSHIVYTDREQDPPTPNTATSQGEEKCGLHPARVIMASAELDPERLRAKYGGQYAEAECVPRRFVVNVTDDVENLISTSKHSQQSTLYTSFLVFVHDGFYDEGLDIFHVIFNSNICTDTLQISQSIPFEQMSVEDIMNRVVCSLLCMKQENRLSVNEEGLCEFMSKPSLSFLYEALSIKVKAFYAQDEINRVSRAGTMQEKANWTSSLNSVVDNMDCDMFCDICYENINQTQVGTASGTQLSRCGHRFCDECWRMHFRGQFKQGAAKMVCPGYDCNVIVGPVTLLSLLHVSEVSHLFQRVCEEDAESSPHCRWCPNPSCGRIVKLDKGNSISQMSHDVTCLCGKEFCFLCLSHPHWPATCQQAEAYTDNLESLVPPQEADEERQPAIVPIQQTPKTSRKNDFVEVEGRVCPKCSRFIEKRGGCQHITCKCGNEFCWWCLKRSSNHDSCKPNSFLVFEYTRRLRIKHFERPNSGVSATLLAPPAQSTIRRPKSRQRTTVTQKALQQRLEAEGSSVFQHNRAIVSKILRVCQRDVHFKKELFRLLNVETEDTDNSSMKSVEFHATKFLRSCMDIKRALHHVAEFTFVLLQDIPDSVDRRRILRLANDLSGYCSFIRSILDLGENQDMKTAVRRLVDIQARARRGLITLMSSVNLIRYSAYH